MVGYCNGVVFNSVIVMERDSLIVVVQFLLHKGPIVFEALLVPISKGQKALRALLVKGNNSICTRISKKPVKKCFSC